MRRLRRHFRPTQEISQESICWGAVDSVGGARQKNLIVPIVGDFAGPKAIKAVGQYLRQHQAAVRVLYISNVEDYLSGNWPEYRANLASLPMEPTGLFIRFVPQQTQLRPITEVPARWPGRNW